MNSIFLVLPILCVLMYSLGLNLELKDFYLVFKRFRAVAVGLLGQILLLPTLAFCLAYFLKLEPIYAIGLVLIACCPGGSSSNIFSMLAKGDIALSVSLTAISSVVTLFTIPFILNFATSSFGESIGVSLPIGKLLVQNILSMLLPICLGILTRKLNFALAQKIDKVLSKLAFPFLMLLAAIFFIQNKDSIIDNFSILGLSVTSLLIASICFAALVSIIFRLNLQEKRTIVIEVGMQNAAQAIAIASSPFVLGDSRFAIPAIIYALMMNIVLLSYVAVIKRFRP